MNTKLVIATAGASTFKVTVYVVVTPLSLTLTISELSPVDRLVFPVTDTSAVPEIAVATTSTEVVPAGKFTESPLVTEVSLTVNVIITLRVLLDKLLRHKLWCLYFL